MFQFEAKYQCIVEFVLKSFSHSREMSSLTEDLNN